MGCDNIRGPELEGHRSKIVLEESANLPLPKVRRAEALEADGTNTGSTRAYSHCVERARSVVAHLGIIASHRTDRPLTPRRGSGEIRVEQRRTLVLSDPVSLRDFPVRVRGEVPV